MLVVLASALASVAAALGAHLAMYLLFFVLFVPAGFYVMLSEGLFRVIGYLDLVYLGAAAMVHFGVRNKERGTGKPQASQRG
jgi:multisubunit Na+/H+ antiporter MnhC subunit